MEDLERRDLPACPYVSIRQEVERDRVGVFLGPAYAELQAFVAAHGLTVAGPPMALYFAATDTHFDMAAALPIRETAKGTDRVTCDTTPAGPALVHEHRGHYDRLKEVWPLFSREIGRLGATPRLPCREEYLTDPGAMPDPSHWRTLLVQPIEG